MTRLVSIVYLVPVYATVDIDTEPNPGDTYPENTYPDEAVTRIFEDDEGIRLSDNPIQEAIEADEEDGRVNPDTLTEEERKKAIEIAENTIWPAWERG